MFARPVHLSLNPKRSLFIPSTDCKKERSYSYKFIAILALSALSVASIGKVTNNALFSLHIPPFSLLSDEHSSLTGSASELKEDSSRYHNESPWPKIAWLMSFPASGTTFTLHLVSEASNTTFAKNHGVKSGYLDENGYAIPVHADNDNGPYLKNEKELPKHFILTKTHCGFSNIIDSIYSFTRDCCRGTRIYPLLEDGNKIDFTEGFHHLLGEKKVYYDTNIVHKAVHLFRNPFDNLIARFHNNNRKNGTHVEWLRNNPEDHKEEFLAWCHEKDSKITESEVKFYGESFPKDIPCHSELFRYIKWHNRAFEVTRNIDIPTLVIHYESFDLNFEKTMSDLFSFLELEIIAPALPFTSHSYPDLYSSRIRSAAIRWMTKLASKETLEQLERYFS